MSFDEVAANVRAAGVVPVVTLPDPDVAIPLSDSLREGGINIIEVTFRAPGAAQAIAAITAHCSDVYVGAGTITDPKEVKAAHSAGARFAVAPGLNVAVVKEADAIGLPFWPGVCTPSEIERALSLGHKLLKYFPAAAMGGPTTIGAVLAPYRHLGLELIPTGGIDETSAHQYWQIDGVAAVGGTWIAPKDMIAGHQWQAISARAQAARLACLQTRTDSRS